jgi:hypothetical protein
METGAGAILLVIGVVALFAAIVGGGVKIKEIEVGSLPSRWRQGMLAIFGIVVGITGLVMVSGILDSGSGNAAEAEQNIENNSGDASSAPEAAADTNAVGQDTAEENSSDVATDDNSTQEAAPQ